MDPRPATLADAAELVRLINLAYQVEADMFVDPRTSTDDVCERLAAPNAGFLAIDAPGTGPGRLAAAVYVERHGARGYFGMLSVDPAYQGRGLGRALVRAAEAHCRAAGCAVLEIDVVDLRIGLPEFYVALGYTRTGVTPYPDASRTRQPVHLIRMEKPLR